MKKFLILFFPLITYSLVCMENPDHDTLISVREESSSSKAMVYSSLLSSLVDDSTEMQDPENALQTLLKPIEQIWISNKGSFFKALKSIELSSCSDEYKTSLKSAIIYGLNKGRLVPIETSDEKRLMLIPSLIKQSSLLATLSENSPYVVTQPMQLQCDSSSLEYLQELSAWLERYPSENAKNGCDVFNKGRYVFDTFARYKVADYLGMNDAAQSFIELIDEHAYAGKKNLFSVMIVKSIL